MNVSHWTYKGKPFIELPENVKGFVYEITNTLNGRKYIGKKQTFSTRKLKPLKGKKRKRIVTKESNWKTYTSSSKYIKIAVDEQGIENFTFNILTLHTNLSELNFTELKIQIYKNVLDELLEDGSRAYYNEGINRQFYHTTDDIILEERNLIDKEFKLIV